MSDTRCVCCDLPAESCGKAAEQRAQQSKREQDASTRLKPGVIDAQYDGRCACCGEPFAAGDPIKHSDIDHGWVAGCCL